MSVDKQVTLTGDVLDPDEFRVKRTKPGTIVVCSECGKVMMRHERFGHPHDVFFDGGDDDNEDTGDDEPEQVGGLYDITLEYNVTYRFRVAAYNDKQAEERAKDLRLDAAPVDLFHMHTDRREIAEIYEDDAKVPDDWDPYGPTRLWEVYGDDK